MRHFVVETLGNVDYRSLTINMDTNGKESNILLAVRVMKILLRPYNSRPAPQFFTIPKTLLYI